MPFGAPHFVEMVLAAAGDVRADRIQTTIDAGLQAEVPASSRATEVRCNAMVPGMSRCVVLDNASGEWLAWEGSGNYADAARGGAINGAIAPRQPGSALKPFTYALAFEKDSAPASVLADVPSIFRPPRRGWSTARATTTDAIRGPLLARARWPGLKTSRRSRLLPKWAYRSCSGSSRAQV